MKLNLSEARKLQLFSQGLLTVQPFGLGKSSALKAIRQLSYVQIDTISVVQRAHHHVLWSRIPDYQPSWLHQFQSLDKSVFEYWSHAAAYLPIEDFRFCLPRMMKYRNGEKHWWEKDKKMMTFVLKQIEKNGPMLARDFENTTGRKAGPWFDRTPAKKALEYLFHEGRLLISERKGFQKVYEIADRYLPQEVNRIVPTECEFHRHLITTALRANGLATAKEIAYLRKGLAAKLNSELKKMVKEKILTEVKVANLKEDFFKLKEIEIPDFKRSPSVHILSPFDNLVIQRNRLKNFFEFDYQIECYVPAPKRKFGYFVLPILSGENFVAKMDAKADRAKKEFQIRSLYIEPERKKEFLESKENFADTLKRFAQFNSCKTINLDCLNKEVKQLIGKLL